MDDPGYFDISETYSVVYHRFMAMNLAGRPAIRGQLEGPVSFGFNVRDQDDRPILFDDTVRPFMFEFMARRINIQLARLKKINPNAFIYVDEPGLQFLFSAMSGYNDMRARDDLDQFFSMIERPRGVHLCGNPDWDFLLNRDLDILSMDIYTNGEVFPNYASSIKRFLDRGGILVWGIVPTNVEPFRKENKQSLTARLEQVWQRLTDKGIDRDLLLRQSMLSPATCCLVNPDKEKTVEQAFVMVKEMSEELRGRYKLEATQPFKKSGIDDVAGALKHPGKPISLAEMERAIQKGALDRKK
jgi:hypothetical protein